MTAARLALALAAAALWIGCRASAPPGPPLATSPPPSFRALELLGDAVISGDAVVDGAPVGGLSGITYDAEREVYYSISDDPASRGPARVVTVTLDLADGSLSSEDVHVRSSIGLLDTNGAPFAAMTLDSEGIALTPERTLYVSSEGQADAGVEPFLREFGLDGRHLRSLSVPERYMPDAAKTRGIRHNLGFESATVAPSGRFFYSSTENALLQDGPGTDLDVASPARILRYERGSGRLAAEYAYWVEPVTDVPPDPEAFRTRGLVELLALDDDTLLALERSYTQGVGNAVDLFLVSLAGASDVRRVESLGGADYRPVEKTRILELAGLDVELDNLEGMTFGPRLADGRRTLVMVADNNFSSRQRNQILALAIGEKRLDIPQIQGAGHRSTLEGAWVRGVQGTVTALAARGPGFWVQGGSDDDPNTSDALLVVPAEPQELEPGTSVELDGWVREVGFPGALTVTSLEAAAVAIGESAPLPRAVLIGPSTEDVGARVLPAGGIDDDRLEVFSPDEDAIDFFESLEGMRVAAPSSVVVGPTTRFGEFVVVAEAGVDRGAWLRSGAGGLIATADDSHPERLLIAARDAVTAPSVHVGDRFDDRIEGVLDYAFGAFRILADATPAPKAGGLEPETSTLFGTDEALVIASYNVENLSAESSAEKYRRVARSIVSHLGSPDILALQEIQDDTGPEDDGVVSADATLERLLEAIAAEGGPAYAFRQIDPQDHADGGQPGANIRVAFIFRPDRVVFVPRDASHPNASTASASSTSEPVLLLDEIGPFLAPNPARLGSRHPAYAADPARDLTGVRKPLVAEFVFSGRRLFLVNVHLRSKRGDSALFGSVQPPERNSEPFRVEEARVVGDFARGLLTLDPQAAVVVLGDFNEHAYREPVRLLAGSGLTNLIELLPVSDRYTYIYRGNSQVLDHVLVSASLAEAEPEIDIVHANADFANRERASDHDPVVARLRLAPAVRPKTQDDS